MMLFTFVIFLPCCIGLYTNITSACGQTTRTTCRSAGDAAWTPRTVHRAATYGNGETALACRLPRIGFRARRLAGYCAVDCTCVWRATPAKTVARVSDLFARLVCHGYNSKERKDICLVWNKTMTFNLALWCCFSIFGCTYICDANLASFFLRICLTNLQT